MKKILLIGLPLIAGISFLSLSFTPGNVNTSSPYIDTFEQERNRYMNEVLQTIKGKEKMSADSVFKNIQLFKGVKNFTAEHFLLMMNIGWGKGLGVSCTYCHVPGRWDSDEKQTKEIGREMYGIRQMVNDKLKTIQGLQSVQPLINCGTCHQGQPIPNKEW
jgi:hypothetical protein